MKENMKKLKALARNNKNNDEKATLASKIANLIKTPHLLSFMASKCCTKSANTT